jgi:hypothetical protein
MIAGETRCPACRTGTLILVGRPGRVVRHGGVDIAVPRDFMIPTCVQCGFDRLDAAQADALAAMLVEGARLMALRVAQTEEMDPIAGDNDDDDGDGAGDLHVRRG